MYTCYTVAKYTYTSIVIFSYVLERYLNSNTSFLLTHFAKEDCIIVVRVAVSGF